jgi:hypothetical protein
MCNVCVILPQTNLLPILSFLRGNQQDTKMHLVKNISGLQINISYSIVLKSPIKVMSRPVAYATTVIVTLVIPITYRKSYWRKSKLTGNEKREAVCKGHVIISDFFLSSIPQKTFSHFYPDQKTISTLYVIIRS